MYTTHSPSRPYDLLIFDWDGTIMDSTNAIAACIQTACLAVGQPKPSLKLAKHVIGLGLREALVLCAPNLPSKDYDSLSKQYYQAFLDQINSLYLFEGVKEQLNQLVSQGYLLAVATGKNRHGLNKVLEQTQLTNIFSATRTPDEAAAKPAPDMILELLNELNIPASRALMIGDTTHDINMAHNAKINSFAVSQGAHTEETLVLSKPTYLASHISELTPWLISLS
ncbi:MAG: hypothetical protein RL344_1075 [Pseudomonadota bacterium]|jgi:phosphoglycolate phosphatase